MITSVNASPKLKNGWIRLPIPSDIPAANYSLWDFYTLQPVPYELVPIRQETKNIPERKGNADYEMVFRVEYPLMEGRAYVLTSDPLNAKSYQKSFSLKLKEENVLTNGHISLKFDSNGNLYEVGNLDSNITSQINQRFCFYQSVVG